MAFTFMPQAGVAGDPKSTEQRRLMAQLMLQKASQPRKIESHTQGMAQIAQALMGGLAYRNAEKAGADQRKASSDAFRKALASTLGGGATPIVPQQEQGSSVPDGINGIAPSSAPSDGRTALAMAVQKVESNNNPNAVSPKGAQGLMQVMPATAKDPGFGVQPAADGSTAENIRVGDQYLDAMLKRYKGDMDRALVAYNWGPGNADKWDGDPAKLPEETRNYVQRVRQNLGGGQPAPAQPSTPQGPNPLVSALSDPNLNPQQQALIAQLYGQQQRANKSDVLSPEAFKQKLALRNAGKTTITNNAGQSPFPGLAKLPKDYTYVYENGQPKLDENGLPVIAPLPGSPSAQKAEKAEVAQERQEKYDNIVTQEVSKAVDLIKKGGIRFPVTGFGAETFKNIGGTDAYQLGEFLKTIAASAGFDRLQAMRDSSPTGGALGQVSERELVFLQATLGSLAQGQYDENLVDNLKRIGKIYEKAAAYPNAKEFGFDSPLGEKNDKGEQPSLEDLVKKYGQ